MFLQKSYFSTSLTNYNEKYMSNFSSRHLNYYVLCKQHLTEETSSSDVTTIVKDICGLHATSPTTPYISLHARKRNFNQKELDCELYEKKALGKIRCVRKTVYILPREFIPAVFTATRNMVEITSRRYAQYLGVTQHEYETSVKKIMETLRGRALTVRGIKKELNMSINLSSVVNLMCDQGLLIRGKPERGWRSNNHTYRILKEQFQDINLNVEEEYARRILIEYYLSSFAPVTENDIMWWTGLPRSDVIQAIESLLTFKLNFTDLDELYLAPISERKQLNHLKYPDTSIVNFLPYLDSYLMGYKDRQRYLDPDYTDKIFDQSGNVTSTILLDGKIVGVWDCQRTTIKIMLFKNTPEDIFNQICSKARETGKFITGKDTQVKICNSMTPLPKRTAGGVMTPLRDS